jgi:60kDa lysophospholipase
LLKNACDKGVIILNCTQCVRGDVQPHYAAGAALRKCGVIGCGDMTPEAALIKLGWLLGSGMGVAEVKKQIQLDLRGELRDLKSAEAFDMTDKSFAKAVYTVLKRQHSSLLRANISGATNLVSKIEMGLLPPIICNFAATGAVDELSDIFKSRNNHTVKTLSPDIYNSDKRTGLHLAAANNQIDVVKFFINQGADVNLKDVFGRTPLREAVDGSHSEVMVLLREHGAEIGLSDIELATVLCLLVRKNEKDKLKTWLQCGIDPNVREFDGRTPLMIACAGVDIETVTILLNEGANPTAKDIFNKSVMYYAQKGANNADIINVLHNQCTSEV